MYAMGLSNFFRRLEAARAWRRLRRDEIPSELDLLRATHEGLNRLVMEDARFRDELSKVLGLTREDSSTRFGAHTIKVHRSAKAPEIMAEVERLKALEADRTVDPAPRKPSPKGSP